MSNARWRTFPGFDTNCPVGIVILDVEWYDNNSDAIKSWLEKNSPMSKSQQSDYVLIFPDAQHYTFWSLSWSL
jgi:hypothetical protein